MFTDMFGICEFIYIPFIFIYMFGTCILTCIFGFMFIYMLGFMLKSTCMFGCMLKSGPWT